jgi:glutathione S-transferase
MAEVGSSGYLVGDRFSVADLTAAALFSPLVQPAELQYHLPSPFPPSIAAYRQTLSDHGAFQWVTEIYSRHRGRSAEVARHATARGHVEPQTV